MTFRFRPWRVRIDLRELCIKLHFMLREREKKDGFVPTRVRHVEGERSDDWMEGWDG